MSAYHTTDLSQNESISISGGLPLFSAKINNVPISKCLRDTGATTCLVAKDLISPVLLENAPLIECKLADGSLTTVPQVILNIESKFYNGTVQALVFPTPSFAFILGNIAGALFPSPADVVISHFETRSTEFNKFMIRSNTLTKHMK